MKVKDWFSLQNKKSAFAPAKTKRDKETLQGLLQYEASRKRHLKFERRADVAPFFGIRWQMDVADLGGSKAFNAPALERRAKVYALVVIDLFSKFVFARALPTKKGKDVVKQLKIIFGKLKAKRYSGLPTVVESDKGREFSNSVVAKYFDSLGIIHKFEMGKLKNQVVERCIREFKKISVLYLERYPSQLKHWRTVAPAVASILNERPNRSLNGLSPNQIFTEWPSVREKVINRMNITPFKRYVALQKRLLIPGFKVKDGNKKLGIGDWVLLIHEKTPYEKETVRNYTYKPYQIVAIAVDRKPFMYKVRDAKGKKGKRLYYAKELQVLKGRIKGRLPLAGVLDEKKVKGKTYWLARFVDHGKPFDKWIPEKKKSIAPPRDATDIPRGDTPIKASFQKLKGGKRGRKKKNNKK